LVDWDWREETMELAPPLGTMFSEEAIRFIKDAGFKIEAAKDSGALSLPTYSQTMSR